MLGPALDVFRLRQYFNALTRARQWATGLREDAGFLAEARRAVVRLPFDRPPVVDDPFPTRVPPLASLPSDHRVAIVATGGSGALASVVGVARAFEEAGVTPAVISVCSGSSLFGYALGAGIPAAEVARFTLSLRPDEYLDLDWFRLLTLVPTAARGFAGLLAGDALEETFTHLVGDMTLGEMPIPTYAPIWSIEDNRVEYLGPATHPEVTVARAIRMGVALPLFYAPVELDGRWWCDGGIVDIFPVHPVLDLEPRVDSVIAVNGFYPPAFAGEDATGWQRRAASILHVASQVRTCQQIELARENLDRLRETCDVAMIEPVPYHVVQGIGFYRQFLSSRDWADFMRTGHRDARRALSDLDDTRRDTDARVETPAS